MPSFSHKLLRWYEKSERTLPWRISVSEKKQGKKPDPYCVWLSEIMLQQTNVTTVKPYFEKFIDSFPTLEALAKAPIESILQLWAGLGYYSRARNLHQCAIKIDKDYGGIFPLNEKELQKLPGIGRYTAAALCAIAFDQKSIVVDGNVERIMARLFQIPTPPKDNIEEIYNKAESLLPEKNFDHYAQALMDLGSLICTVKSPQCSICPVQKFCLAFKNNNQSNYPIKKQKIEKPQKYHKAFWIENKRGEILLYKRPPLGLLGGMTCFPCTLWEEESIILNCSKNYQNHAIKKGVKHIFTHFMLFLELEMILCMEFKKDLPENYFKIHKNALNQQALPSLMQKAANNFQKQEEILPLLFSSKKL